MTEILLEGGHVTELCREQVSRLVEKRAQSVVMNTVGTDARKEGKCEGKAVN